VKKISVTLCALLFATGAHASCYQQLKQRFPVAGTIVFGEMHGSAEIPQFVFDCAREFAANKEQVRVFLELPVSDNRNIEKFVRGEIGEDDVVKTRHWSGQDGRASEAMLRLLRDLKTSGIPVSGFDMGAGERDREKAMARNFMGAYSRTGYNLVLVGNVHARLVNGAPWGGNPDFVPFAKQLRDQGADLVSLDARYSSGSAWNCAPDCGVHPAMGGAVERNGADSAVVYSNQDPAFNGYFHVGSITASRPVHEK
jgi:hypothetical protein